VQDLIQLKRFSKAVTDQLNKIPDEEVGNTC
jgi:hypothetical protein